MTTYSRFHSDVVSLTLDGVGETQEEALNQILAKMRQRVMQERRGPILFMAPLDLEVTACSVDTWTERFLFILWPRTRHRYRLEANLKVEVRWVEFTTPHAQEVSR